MGDGRARRLPRRSPTTTSGRYLDRTIFADAAPDVVEPDPADVEGYATFLDRYVAGLDIERVAVATTRPATA